MIFPMMMAFLIGSTFGMSIYVAFHKEIIAFLSRFR
jgi:hypothetical protein